jgi:predicted adenylyl cyclase CyaB
MVVKKELKLKARIENMEEIRSRVKNIARFLRKSQFIDSFFRSQTLDRVYELRVRKSGNKKIVSLKVLLSTNDVQENAVYRFGAQDTEDFVEFLESLGFKPCLLLRKNSELYAYGNITIELTNAEGFGDYLELIIYTENHSIKKDTQLLKKLAQKLGIKEKLVDLRNYSCIKKDT